MSDNNIKIAVASDASSYSIDFGPISLIDCRAAIRLWLSAGSEDHLESFSGLTLSSDGQCVSIKGTSKTGSIEIDFSPSENTPNSIEISATLTLMKAVRRIEIYPLFGVTLHDATHLVSHGRTMGGCKICRLPATNLYAEPGEEKGATFTSHFQTMISFANCKLHATHPLHQKNVSCMTGKVSGDKIEDFAIVTRLEFPERGSHSAERATLSLVTDGHKALCNWGDMSRTCAPTFEPPPIGWNSWDYYRWTISEDEVLKNAEFIASDRVLSKCVKNIIVDDGWQYCYGEWEPNSLFKSGMDSLARNLRKMGFTPGLWICPGITEPHCVISQWQTDWLAMGEGGDPCLSFSCMGRNGFILDPTVPAVKEWLFKLFAKYADMGFGYFKTDFLMPVCLAPRFHREIPRGLVIRELMTPIIDAIRGKATLLGCGYDYTGGNDMVRMVRAGGDIHATWNNVKHNAISVAARFWASNRVWITDPDFCVCRGPETSNDPNLGRLQCLLIGVKPTETRRGPSPDIPWNFGFDSILAHEAETLLSIAIINGGALNFSDKLYTLNDVGLDKIRRTAAASRGQAPLPIDLFESDIPAKWLQKIDSGYRVLLINWGDDDAELSFNLNHHGINAYSFRNFWTDEMRKIDSNVIRTTVRGHGCLLAEIAQG